MLNPNSKYKRNKNENKRKENSKRKNKIKSIIHTSDSCSQLFFFKFNNLLYEAYRQTMVATYITTYIQMQTTQRKKKKTNVKK